MQYSNLIRMPLLIKLFLVVSVSTADGVQPNEKGDHTNTLGMVFKKIPPGKYVIGKDCLIEAITDTVLSRMDRRDERHEFTDSALNFSILLTGFDRSPRAAAYNALSPYYRIAKEVDVVKPIYMGKYQVTLGQFLAFYHDAKYTTQSERESTYSYSLVNGKRGKSANNRPWSPGWKIEFNHPVVYVSWHDANAFCEWLSKKEGKKYRLPTEIEWEYACRAGSQSLYHFGNNRDEYERRNENVFKSREGVQFTFPVGSFPANAFGICDMHGNVCEWCSESFNDSYRQNAPVFDPSESIAGPRKINRIGGIYIAGETPADGLFKRTQFRRWHENTCHYDLGFRVVCENE